MEILEKYPNSMVQDKGLNVELNEGLEGLGAELDISGNPIPNALQRAHQVTQDLMTRMIVKRM